MVVEARASLVPETVDRAGQGELGGAQAGDEVAPPDLTPLLELLEDRIDAGKATLDPLGEGHLPGQHAVALQQLLGPGEAHVGGERHRAAELVDQRPPTGPGGWPDPARARRWR